MDIGLTQEQIDAMLGAVGTGGAEPSAGGLSAAESAALADFERETMGNLAGVLNAMTGFEYTLADIEYTPTSPAELPLLLSEDLIFSLPITVGEVLTHYLVLEAPFAKQVAAVLTGGDPGDTGPLGEMEMSAIQEVVSQINGTYLTNISRALATKATGEAVQMIDVGTLGAAVDATTLLGTLTLQLGAGELVQIRHLLPGRLGEMILQKVSQAVTAPPPSTVSAAPRPAPQPGPVAAPPMAAQASPAMQIPPVSSGHVMGATTEYQPVTFSQLVPPMQQVDTRNLDILLDVPLAVTVELGKTTIPIRHILEYGQGSLITLDKLAGEPIDLLVNGKYFAKGEVVVIDENFGIRITSILSPAERIAQLS